MAQPESSQTPVWLRLAESALLPLAIGIVGAIATCSAAEIPVRGRLTEVAVEVLRAPPSDSTRAIRAWARRIIDKYSGVPFGPAADSALSRSRLPVALNDSDRFLSIHDLDLATLRYITGDSLLCKKSGGCMFYMYGGDSTHRSPPSGVIRIPGIRTR